MNFCLFFLAVLKSSGKTGGTGPQLSGATHINLVLNYDALLEFDPSTSMVSARV